MIEAASLSDGELAWVYAGYESLWIHDRHDARWINAAEGGNWSDDEFSDFLRAYGLVRGKAGHNVFCEKQKQNRQKFANLCRDMFMAPLPLGSEWAELTRRWVCAAKKVGSRFEQENGFLSATSKVLWFYHPDHWVMYDTLNRAGLKTWTGKATDSAEAFADAFCNFFDEFGRRALNLPPQSCRDRTPIKSGSAKNTSGYSEIASESRCSRLLETVCLLLIGHYLRALVLLPIGRRGPMNCGPERHERDSQDRGRAGSVRYRQPCPATTPASQPRMARLRVRPQ
jgi:hypothetical protein